MFMDSQLKIGLISQMLIPLTTFVVVILCGFAVRKIILNRLAGWAGRTKSKIDDIVIESIRAPFMIWFMMLGLYLGFASSSLPEKAVALAGKILFVLGSLSVTLVLANISSEMIKLYSGKIHTGRPITSLTQNISRIGIFVIGALIILNSLGVSITPILATLGVGGLAVALALQDTLSNLFAGFHIIVSRQVRIGDYIKLESQEEGYVTDITWRTTKIKMLPNNIVLVPNEKLAKAIVVNYYLPDREMAVLVDLGVHYASDLAKVEKISCEIAKDVMKEVAGGVPDFEPFIRYHTFADFSIKFTVILRAKEFVDQYLIKHEFIKRLHERYAREGIVIPYPVRAINYAQEKSI